MTILEFPPIETADKHGLLAIGGDLDIDSLLLAYRSGIFPWPFDEETLAWFCPPSRALLFLNEVHVPRSLLKFQKRSKWHFKFDINFESVVRKCAAALNRGDQTGTWITEEVISGYTRLHRAGYAHSVECYEEDSLIAGAYGVAIGKFFAAESMFYRKPNSSKLALLHLLEHLKLQGVEWIDCQQLNPVTKTLGARNVSRKKFLVLLAAAIDQQPLQF